MYEVDISETISLTQNAEFGKHSLKIFISYDFAHPEMSVVRLGQLFDLILAVILS